MKVLAFSSYYTPEIAASMYLTEDIYKGIVDAGHTLEVYVPMPTRGVSKETRKKYRNKKNEKKYDGKLTIHRVSMYRECKNTLLRSIRYLLINAAFIWKGINTKADIIFVQSTPPTQGLMAGIIGILKREPVVYNVQDVFPDSLVSSGITKKDSILWKIGRKIEDFSYSHANGIIAISESIKDNIINKGVDKSKIEVIPNWIDINEVKPVSKKQNSLYKEYDIDINKFTVVYAGNFGAVQGADIILKVAKILQNEDIQFVVFGTGAYFKEAMNEASKCSNVIISEILPVNRVSEVYSLGDVALIVCKPGTGKAAMPSKTWSIMACNTRIIASFDKGSELERVLNESEAGICVEAGNVTALASAIVSAKKNLGISHGRDYLITHLSKDKAVKKYVKILECKSSEHVINSGGLI